MKPRHVCKQGLPSQSLDSNRLTRRFGSEGYAFDSEAMPKQCRSNAEAMPKQCRSNAEAMPKQCRSNAEASETYETLWKLLKIYEISYMSSTDFNLYISVHCTCSTTNHTFKTCNVRSLRLRTSPTSNIAGSWVGLLQKRLTSHQRLSSSRKDQRVGENDRLSNALKSSEMLRCGFFSRLERCIKCVILSIKTRPNWSYEVQERYCTYSKIIERLNLRSIIWFPQTDLPKRRPRPRYESHAKPDHPGWRCKYRNPRVRQVDNI